MRFATLKAGEGLKASFMMLILFLTPFYALAATLSVEYVGITPSGEINLAVYAETNQKNPFNSAEATIVYELNGAQIQSIDTSNSIFNIWSVPPKIVENEILFSGGTSAKGGFIFKGKLFDFVISQNDNSSGTLVVENSRILASDGVGSDIKHFNQPYSFSTNKAVPEHFDTSGDGEISIEELSIGLTN